MRAMLFSIWLEDYETERARIVVRSKVHEFTQSDKLKTKLRKREKQLDDALQLIKKIYKEELGL